MALVLAPHELRKVDLKSQRIRSATTAKRVTGSSTATNTQLTRCHPGARGEIDYVASGHVLIDPLDAAVGHRLGLLHSALLLRFCRLTVTDCQGCGTVFFPLVYDAPARSSARRDREPTGSLSRERESGQPWKPEAVNGHHVRRAGDAFGRGLAGALRAGEDTIQARESDRDLTKEVLSPYYSDRQEPRTA